MQSEAQFSIKLLIEVCCNSGCGIMFAVPENWQLQKRRDHSSFYCPNGHSQHYLTESDAEKANRLAELKAQAIVNEERHLRLVAEAERDKAVRAKNKIERRIAKGVCPCCNRQFSDLHKHMKMKHKSYGLPPGSNPKQIAGTVQ